MTSNAPSAEAPDEASALYEKCPLKNPDSLRLIKLDLHPYDTSVHCTLEPFELGKAPPYTALSYTWDCPYPDDCAEHNDAWTTASYLCVCNEYLLRIRRNLFLGLQKLISLNFDAFLWVDAICINQENIEEVGQQVTRMGAIFSCAQEVIAWIGEDLGEAEDFFWIHNELLPSLQERFVSTAEYDFVPLDVKNLSYEELLGLGMDRLKRCAPGYARILKRKWFSWAWVVQEIGLSQEARLLCGSAFISWTSISNFQLFVTRHFLKKEWVLILQEYRADLTPVTARRSIHVYFLIRLYMRQPERFLAEILHNTQTRSDCSKSTLQATSLLFFAERIRHLECKDGRDKIFSLIGVVNRLISQESECPSLIADYSLTLSEVLTTAVSRCVSQTSSMYFLTLREDLSFRRHTLLPSWVPDVTASSGDDGLIEWRLYGACDSPQTVDSVPKIEGHLLHVYGTKLDELVKTNTKSHPAISSGWGTLIDYWKRNLEFCSDMEVKYSTGENRLEAFWRTMICNFFRSRGDIGTYPALEGARVSFSRFLLHTLCLICLRWRELAATESGDPLESLETLQTDILQAFEKDFAVLDDISRSQNDVMTLTTKEVVHLVQDVNRWCMLMKLHNDPRFSDTNRTVGLPPTQKVVSLIEESGQLGHPFRRALESVNRHRRLLRTSQGFIALGPVSAATDDEVWFLQGSNVPFLLRPGNADGSYRLVGAAYVHGLMHGEIWNMKDCQDFSWITIS